MTKKVYVTHAQTRAAKKLVARSAITGRYVSPSVRKIADATSVQQEAPPPGRRTRKAS